jgi:disulfide bond formation protein DsbB
MLSGSSPTGAPAYRLGGMALFLASAVILVALGFEHLGGYVPCPLCLQQRYAYFAGIPLLYLAMALAAEMPRTAALLFLAVALAFLVNAGLGTYQAGAEWKLWAGPATCSGAQPLPATAADLLKGLAESRVIRCDEASWRFAGLSFAGWNVVVSLLIFGAALKAANATFVNKSF